MPFGYINLPFNPNYYFEIETKRCLFQQPNTKKLIPLFLVKVADKTGYRIYNPVAGEEIFYSLEDLCNIIGGSNG